MPTISPAVTSAQTMLGQPGKNAKNGTGISARNMNNTPSLSIDTGSFCAYQPSGDSSGWFGRKPFRNAASSLRLPMNFCLPKPNITRNTSKRYAQQSAGAGALTAASGGSGSVAGKNN